MVVGLAVGANGRCGVWDMLCCGSVFTCESVGYLTLCKVVAVWLHV